MQIVHKDLVDKDFMTRLIDMDEESQRYIKEAGLQTLQSVEDCLERRLYIHPC